MNAVTERQQLKEHKQFGMSDKVGYMLGDLGNDLFFGLVSSYLMVFYTDILGLTGGAIGTMLIIARVWDAINDPMMGTFVDRRKAGKHGKFRPYLIYAALPVTLMGFLTFTFIPSLPEGLRLPYAYITYIGFGMCYTAINIPYGSLASVMTTDPVERTSLSTWRTVGAILANVIIMVVVPKIAFVDGTATAQGFMKAVGLFVILSNLCYFGAFKLTTERIQHPPKKDIQKTNLLETIKMLTRNRALLGIMIASFGMLSAMLSTQALTAYLYKDYFKAPELMGLAGFVGLVSTFIILPVLGKLVKKYGKKELATVAMAIGSGAYFVLFLMPISNPYIFMAGSFIASLGTGFFNILIWAMVSDTIDYQEYITGKREEGIVYASYSLVRKLGQAVAGGIGGFALTFIGYQSGVAQQSEAVAKGIKAVSTGLPAVLMLVGFLAMLLIYNLSKSRLVELNKELELKRANI